MKKIILTTLIISALFLTACSGNNDQISNGIDENSQDKIKVYTSFYTLYDFASKIGGDHAQVINMISPGGEPHHWEPKASDIMNLEEADIFIYNGLSLEHWVDSVLDTIENENIITLQASQGVEILDSSHSHSSGHGMDPHIWLDPIRARTMFENIKNAFIEADPGNEEYYENNYRKYVEELEKLDEEYRQGLSNISSRDLVVSHEAFTYLSDAYNLQQIGIEAPIPDSEPNPGRMAEIIDYVKANNIKTIFYEDINKSKVVESISRESGADFEVLYTLEYLTDEQVSNNDDYFSIMRQNLDSLMSGLK